MIRARKQDREGKERERDLDVNVKAEEGGEGGEGSHFRGSCVSSSQLSHQFALATLYGLSMFCGT